MYRFVIEKIFGYFYHDNNWNINQVVVLMQSVSGHHLSNSKMLNWILVSNICIIILKNMDNVFTTAKQRPGSSSHEVF